MPRLTPVHYRKLAKVLKKKGFVYIRTHGDHLVYQKTGITRPIIIPKYREILEFIILKNLKTAGITRKEYLKLLEKINQYSKLDKPIAFLQEFSLARRGLVIVQHSRLITYSNRLNYSGLLTDNHQKMLYC